MIQVEEHFEWKPKGGPVYRPKNHHGYGGMVSLRSAFINSMNVPAVRTFYDSGMSATVDHIKEDFGFAGVIHAYPSTALGACEVHMQEMLEAYSVFMLDGKRVKPYRIREIIDPTGQLTYQGKMDFVSTRIDADTCRVMDKLMRGVVTSGTGYNANSCPDAHGKTGTTNNGKSGWFCGYAKGVVGIAWAGREYYDQKRKRWLLHDQDEYGNDLAAPFWADAMTSATKKYGSDVRPDLTLKSGDERPRHRPREEDNNANNEEPPLNEDGNNSPVDENKPATAPGTNDQDPLKTGEGTSGPPKDPASETSPKPVNPGIEPKKPKDDKTKNHEKSGEEDFVEVEVCADSGLLVTRYCPETINKKFLKSKRPKKRCTLHKAPNEGGGRP